MTITINGRTIDKWANLSVTLIYNSVKSVFSFDIYWEPSNQDLFWRNLLLPGAYNVCTINSDNGELLLTGVMHSPSFASGAEKYLVNISGCSITGVLDDVEFAAIVKEPQTNGLTIFQIACKCANPLGIYIIDNSGGLGATTISQPGAITSPAEEEQISQTSPATDTNSGNESCTDYLDNLCKDSDITLTHDEYGNLVLSVANQTAPVYNFTEGMPGVKMDLSFDGEKMHSILIGQTTHDSTGQSTQKVYAYNPYVPSNGGFNYRNAAINQSNILNAPAGQLQILSTYDSSNRPGIYNQTDSDPTNLQDFINYKLAQELRAISLQIKIDRWELNKKVIRPGQYITVQNEELYLFKPATFFIESVDFSGDEKSSTAILNCVVPEVYNGEIPVNIFTQNEQFKYFVRFIKIFPDYTIPTIPAERNFTL